jgi:uncharacterized protein YndB with AHSA1/START domain
MSDIIVKSIEIAAPVSRVWEALTDYRQFGKWFRVNLEGPFVPGKVARGPITYPGYEHIIFEAQVEKMEPERYFCFRWHPYAVDPDVDYSGEPTTLVEFRLQPKGASTVITVTESGFDAIPKHRRAEAYRMNDGGWAEQMSNIQRHVQLATSTA